MPTYVAFLRAINLGARRRFAATEIVTAVEAAGGTDVATHGNTGNVRLTMGARSRERVEQTLERAFLADRGFEVPTIAFTPAELVAVAEDVEALAAGHDGRHYVSLLKQEPDAAGRKAVEAAGSAGERAVVRGRAVHLLLGDDYRSAGLDGAFAERHLGVATNRNATVIRTLARKWGA